MHVAIISSLIGVLGSGLLTLLFTQFKSQREEIHSGFAAQSEQVGQLFAAVMAQGERIDRVPDVLRNHGERLARIKTRLDIDPPAEAA